MAKPVLLTVFHLVGYLVPGRLVDHVPSFCVE